MALQGAGDPRWVVRERQDGRNVNSWHWEDKDVSSWAQTRIRQLLTSEVCTASAGDVAVAVENVDGVDGDATLYNRKGVLKVLYDLKISGKWSTSHVDKDARTTGEYKFELFDEEPDVLVMLDIKSKAEHRFKVLFADKVAPLIRSQCQIFIREMHAGAGQALDGVSVPEKKENLSETKVTDYLRSGMDQAAKPVKKASVVGGASLELRDVFTCSAQDMFLGLTDRARLEAITRARALSEAKVGGRFNLLNGAARGSYTALVGGKQVGMTWKLKTWGDEAGEAEVDVGLSEEEQGRTTVVVRIRGVPAEHKSATEGFWRVQIFQAMKVVMGWGSAAQFL